MVSKTQYRENIKIYLFEQENWKLSQLKFEMAM